LKANPPKGVVALVMAASMSAEVVDQDNDVISDRRFRWASSEDESSEEGGKHLKQADDVESDESGSDSESQEDDQSGGSDAGDDTLEVIYEYVQYPEDSWENASDEA
ncbi:hypothetical protein KR009_011217, partial [Drosophila setifemur]